MLANSFALHYAPDLNISFHNDQIVLIGHAWQANPECPSPIEELTALSEKEQVTHEDLFAIEKNWCGRYLLIADGWIYLDACGLINIFYSKDTIASSLGVLSTVENREVILPPIEHRKSPDFVPGMMTLYEGVRRLMPSQLLNITTGTTQLRPLLIDPIPSFASDEEGISTLSTYFIHSVRNLAKAFAGYDIWVASTSGRDSRTSIALMHKAGIKFSTFTLWHQHISHADSILPRRIAKALHLNYRFVKRRQTQFSQQRYDDYRAHTAGMAVDEDWRFYAYNQYPALCQGRRPIVILRSGIWGIANEYYTRKFGEKGKNLSFIYPGILQTDWLRHSAEEWEAMVKADPLNTQIGWIDRIYWELREGCWLASIEQSFDVMDGITSFQLFNSRLLIGTLLRFSLQDRLSKSEENKIALSTCPVLSTVPYDYQYDAFLSQRIRRKLIRWGQKIWNKLH